MKLAPGASVLLILLVSAPVLAAPADEVAAVLQAQGRAFAQGNLEG